jgi:hypothetical protein
MKWFKKQPTNTIAEKRREEKRRDIVRPVRIAERLNLRMQEACDNHDLPRAKVLLRRVRRVRDFQIAEYGN